MRVGQLGAAEQLRQRIPYLVGGDGWPKVLRAPLISASAAHLASDLPSESHSFDLTE
ncbi:hypothetical protein [Stutzerimonas nitrititolerans]|uniref:hypothetical protein n=1 Tax=Stutzerimonas nitrititolerans TaxID=2482751 RepID=UPI0028B1FD6A|nr:hypothetical protein [Stutzerimonas nitrititolerans]